MKISRRNLLKAVGHMVIGGCVAGASGYGAFAYGAQVEAEWLTVEQIKIPLKNLKPALEGFKIVQMSDFHLHPFTKIELVQAAVAMANSLQPDLIVLTGDYVLKGAEAIFELAPVLASLNAKYGVFTILGNHDLWTNVKIVRTGLKESRLPLLYNEGLTLDVGGETLYLAGVDDVWSGQPDLQSALDKQPANTPTLLLVHEPDWADVTSLNGRVALQLSGHSHGGQVRLPGLGAVVLPYLGKKYDQGLYKVNDMWLYTTRGVGLTIVPMRINCPPEITEITLVSHDQAL